MAAINSKDKVITSCPKKYKVSNDRLKIKPAAATPIASNSRNFMNQIMSIDYKSVRSNITNNLNVDPNIEYNEADKVPNMYERKNIPEEADSVMCMQLVNKMKNGKLHRLS
uniref:Uncharacterized protein n=1 Tax=Vespula pensylvanica TaxID=30213 RepID=A0A834KMF7_VESPE|nr:hypothetical protein H0235_014240 [Vespula pensylvanica]